MVFPIGTDASKRQTTPFVTYLLIVINVMVFVLEQNRGNAFISQWSLRPSAFFADPGGQFLTIFTSMFLHASWLHLLGNMAYLWTFGDNIEDDFGHLPFLVFYILAGLIAMLAQASLMQHSSAPNLGASGAIAGVLGAYLVMFPRGTVKILTQRGIVGVPAILALGGWILLQLYSAAGEYAQTTATTGGVAYMAHIAGFICGMILSFAFRSRE